MTSRPKPPTPDEVLDSVVTFFTGPNVIHSSLALEKGGVDREMAKRFFEARDALGITGYMKHDLAMPIARRKLGMK